MVYQVGPLLGKKLFTSRKNHCQHNYQGKKWWNTYLSLWLGPTLSLYLRPCSRLSPQRPKCDAASRFFDREILWLKCSFFSTVSLIASTHQSSFASNPLKVLSASSKAFLLPLARYEHFKTWPCSSFLWITGRSEWCLSKSWCCAASLNLWLVHAYWVSCLLLQRWRGGTWLLILF